MIVNNERGPLICTLARKRFHLSLVDLRVTTVAKLRNKNRTRNIWMNDVIHTARLAVCTSVEDLLYTWLTLTQHLTLVLTIYMYMYFEFTSSTVGHQWLNWFCEAWVAHLTKPGWSKPHTHSNPTNLALFRHEITLYRFNQGGSYYCRWGSNRSRGAEPLWPPHFNHCWSLNFTQFGRARIKRESAKAQK